MDPIPRRPDSFCPRGEVVKGVTTVRPCVFEGLQPPVSEPLHVPMPVPVPITMLRFYLFLSSPLFSSLLLGSDSRRRPKRPLTETVWYRTEERRLKSGNVVLQLSWGGGGTHCKVVSRSTGGYTVLGSWERSYRDVRFRNGGEGMGRVCTASNPLRTRKQTNI